MATWPPASSTRSELDRRVEAGRHERAHAAFADLDDGIADGADIGPAVEHGRIETDTWPQPAPAVPSWRDARRRSAPACRRAVSCRNRSSASRRVDDVAHLVPGRARTFAGDRCGRIRPPRVRDCPKRRAGSFSISAGDFSGKAAARLARPIRCSLSHGPSVRMKPPAKSAMRLRSVARIVRSIPTASDPSARIDAWL